MKGSLHTHIVNCHNGNFDVDNSSQYSNPYIPGSMPVAQDGRFYQGLSTAGSNQVCLHPGCSDRFHSQNSLREHLFAVAPGVAAEHSFLLDSVLQLAELVQTWDSKGEAEKNALHKYVANLRDRALELRGTPTGSSPSSMPYIQSHSSLSHPANIHTHYGHMPVFETCVEIPQHRHHHPNYLRPAIRNQPQQQSFVSLPSVSDNVYAINDGDQHVVSLGTTSGNVTSMHTPPSTHHNTTSSLINSVHHTTEQQYIPATYLNSAFDSIQARWGMHNAPQNSSSVDQSQNQNSSPSHVPNYSQQTSSISEADPEITAMHHSNVLQTMSWEEAIFVSQALLEQGKQRQRVVIHPCPSTKQLPLPEDWHFGAGHNSSNNMSLQQKAEYSDDHEAGNGGSGVMIAGTSSVQEGESSADPTSFEQHQLDINVGAKRQRT